MRLERSNITRDSVYVHMPYLPNLSSPNESLHEKSVIVLLEELKRCSTLGIPYLVLHFGSNLGSGREAGINQFIRACSFALEKHTTSLSSSKSSASAHSHKVTILLENNVGHKNTIGSKFEDIRLILDKLSSFQNFIGICFDSCHAFAAGYDLRSEGGVESTFEKFDDMVGQKNLKLIHLNDSRGKLGSNLDRHETLGLGEIGNEGIEALCTQKSISSVPFIMETPREKHAEDMKLIRSITSKQ
jgi:deoxyribonuclease IV